MLIVEVDLLDAKSLQAVVACLLDLYIRATLISPHLISDIHPSHTHSLSPRTPILPSGYLKLPNLVARKTDFLWPVFLNHSPMSFSLV